MVLKPEKEKEAEAIFRKWGLDFAVVGETTPTQALHRAPRRRGDGRPADQGARRPGAGIQPAFRQRAPKLPVIDAGDVEAADAASPTRWRSCSPRRTCAPSAGCGSNTTTSSSATPCSGRAATPRWCASRTGRRALALTTDVTPRYCEADPFEGGKQAVAECWRNLTAVGAQAAGASPTISISAIRERPEIMGQFVGCVRGIGEACKALDFPVVSGNVSLYNETNGRAILPTPTIGGVGLIDDFTKSATLAFKRDGETILLVGETHGLARPVDLSARDCAAARRARRRRSICIEERENGDFVRALILDGTATAVHDLSDGGLAGRARRDGDGLRHRRQARRGRRRYPGACASGSARTRRAMSSRCRRRRSTPSLARAQDGQRAGVGDRHDRRRRVGACRASAALLVTILRERFEGWLPAYMAGELAEPLGRSGHRPADGDGCRRNRAADQGGHPGRRRSRSAILPATATTMPRR